MDFMSHCSSFLVPSIPVDNKPSLTYALVVLNQPLPRFTPLLWEAAQLRLCADGGANRLYDELPELFPHEDSLDVRNRCKPDVIKGDMDSIRPDVLEFYSNLGTKIVDESHDQDTNDLHKCVSFIQESVPDKSNCRCSNCSFNTVAPISCCNFGCICEYGSFSVCKGALGGRFDHEIGNINVLFRFSNIRIVLISDDCLIYLLPRTHRHEIHILSSVEGPHCGLIPVGVSSAKTTTTGLQWDLNDTEMRFGGLISTSNIVQSERITVQSDSDLLWTISIKKPI